jgi:hypothetical protein
MVMLRRKMAERPIRKRIHGLAGPFPVQRSNFARPAVEQPQKRRLGGLAAGD